MRLAALAIAGVMILATEKLDVVVVLVEVEIEVAAALRAFQQAGEYAGLLRDRGLFCGASLFGVPAPFPKSGGQ